MSLLLWKKKSALLPHTVFAWKKHILWLLLLPTNINRLAYVFQIAQKTELKITKPKSKSAKIFPTQHAHLCPICKEIPGTW